MDITKIDPKNISLPEALQEIADHIGIKNTLKIINLFPGCTIYIPTKASIMKNHIYNKIWEEFNGLNHRSLAIKYNISERCAREKLRDRNKENREKLRDRNKEKKDRFKTNRNTNIKKFELF